MINIATNITAFTFQTGEGRKGSLILMSSGERIKQILRLLWNTEINGLKQIGGVFGIS